MLIGNTRFEQPDQRKWTWRSPDGKHRKMLDMVLADIRWKTSVKVCRTYQGADVSSDHRMVLCNIKLKLNQKPKVIREKKRNPPALENPDTRERFQQEIKKGIIIANLGKLKLDEKE